MHVYGRIPLIAAALAFPTIGFAQNLSEAFQKHITLLGVASATTAPSGTAFVGLAATDRRNPTSKSVDGSLAFGLGFGDANKTVGVQATAFITSLSDSFGDTGYLGLKFSRKIGSTKPAYLGLSVDQLGSWGTTGSVDARANLAFTTFSAAEIGGESYPLMFTVGVGTNVRNNRADAGVFGGAGIGLSKHVAASAAYTGETVTIGGSYRPSGQPNFGVSALIEDVFDSEDNRRLVLSVSWAFKNVFGG